MFHKFTHTITVHVHTVPVYSYMYAQDCVFPLEEYPVVGLYNCLFVSRFFKIHFKVYFITCYIS